MMTRIIRRGLIISALVAAISIPMTPVASADTCVPQDRWPQLCLEGDRTCIHDGWHGPYCVEHPPEA